LRTTFALGTNLALRAGIAFGATAFLETPGTVTAVALGAALATFVTEAFTALAALEAAFAALATALPTMIGGLARGGREDVELGLLGRSGRCRRGNRSCRDCARNRSHRRSGGRFCFRGFIDHGSVGRDRGGGFNLGSRGRSGLSDRSGRHGCRRGDGSGSCGSRLGLGRGGSKTAGIAGQRDH
jgi:hypothetical protein